MKRIMILMLLMCGFVYAANPVPVLEPPMEFLDMPLSDVLDKVFQKAGGAKYVFDAPVHYSMVIVNYKVVSKTDLESFLRQVLTQRDLTYDKDNQGVYHIKKAFEDVENSKYSKMYIEPPLKFQNTPGADALKEVFSTVKAQYKVEVTDRELGSFNFNLQDKMKFKIVLNLMLSPKNLEFYEDNKNMFHIKRRNVYPKMSKVFPVSYMTASEAAAPLKKLFPQEGAVTVDKRSNSIIVQDFGRISVVNELMKEIDAVGRKPAVFDFRLRIVEVAERQGVDEAFDRAKDVDAIISDIISVKGALNVKIISYDFGLEEKLDAKLQSKDKPIINVSAVKEKGDRIKLKINMKAAKTGNDITKELTIDNGETSLSDMTDVGAGKNWIFMAGGLIKDYAPPRCKSTPFISKLEATVDVKNYQVKLDWGKDPAFGANGVKYYNIYRDSNPITAVENMKPIAVVDGYLPNWLDMSDKRIDDTFYYVVTGVNASGMEQPVSPDSKYNAKITIPRTEE